MSKANMRFRLIILVLCLILTQPIFLGAEDEVKVWEEPLKLPTYLAGQPDIFPIFYDGRAYQGAQGRVYPYPIVDQLTDERKDVEYKALYLENKYIKLCVLPQLGGRMFSALDKSNNYDLFYRQSVIKPALIGMLGAWISGGIEWNIPHHHRATSSMPVDYALRENPDGSKTIWIGELELRHRMTWSLGLTLYPDRSTIEATIHIINRTPYPHGMLCWANVAVHTNENYQVIFPPDTQFATYHGKNQFARWPISHEFYNRVDYSKGVDISWWKNLPAPTSFFAWNCQADFLAGYDHGQQAGVLHWADHHIVPGKKFWTWGTGTHGQRWETILSDSDGPYLELMVGAYSDNQPDYSWIKPHEVRTIKQYWYPLRDIGGVKAANLEAALNLKIVDGYMAVLGVNTTSSRPELDIVLKKGGETVFENQAAVAPDRPFSTEVELPEITEPQDLEVVLIAEGEELLRYRPRAPVKEDMPDPVEPPLAPQNIETIEELCLTGQRLEQFYNPSYDPLPYYEEALRRDPEDSSVNIALGIHFLKQGRHDVAEGRFRTALARLTRNYTHPKDCEAYCYLGVALRAQGKLAEAVDAFQLAVWDSAWGPASHLALAELGCFQGDLEAAWEHLEKISALTGHMARYIPLKILLLRKQGRTQEALVLAAKAIGFNPFDFWVLNETYLALGQREAYAEASQVFKTMEETMRGNHQTYLELAIDYGNCGFYEEAIQVLERFIKDSGVNFPVLHYYWGFYLDQSGKTELALEVLQRASQMSPHSCFPFRQETVQVLQHCLLVNPTDALAFYYLGNCVFETQPEMAIAYWERSRALNENYFMVHRNLGLAYARIQNQVNKAQASLEFALALFPGSARLLYELDLISEAAGVDPKKRLEILKANHNIVRERDDALMREIGLLVQLGQYDTAIDYMDSHHFHVWEGGGQIHNLFTDAHLLKGSRFFGREKYQQALKEYMLADGYPENLEVGRPIQGGRFPQVQYYIGLAHERLEQPEAARQAFETSAAYTGGWSQFSYYQGMSLRKLGHREEAEARFEGLKAYAQNRLEKTPPMDFFAKFGEKQSATNRQAQSHYLLGLAYLGLEMAVEAEREFAQAIELNPNHYWARHFQQSLRRD